MEYCPLGMPHLGFCTVCDGIQKFPLNKSMHFEGVEAFISNIKGRTVYNELANIFLFLDVILIRSVK